MHYVHGMSVSSREPERQFLSFHFLSLVNILVLVAGDSGHDGDDDSSGGGGDGDG